MGGLRNRAGRVAGVTKAVLAAVLLGGTLTTALGLALATQASAFSATPQWFTTAGAPASSLTCGTWYVHDDGVVDRRRERHGQPDRWRRRWRREQYRPR